MLPRLPGRMRLRVLVLGSLFGVWLAAAPGLATPASAEWDGRCATKSVKFKKSGNGVVQSGPTTNVDGNELAVGANPYIAKGVKVTLTMQDTVFVVYPGTYFRPECFGAYGKGPYPSVKLYLGKVRVRSKATSRRLAVQSAPGATAAPQQTGVRAWEAIVHTLSPHSFEYEVERDAKAPADGGKGRVTVRTVKGGPVMLSPRHGLKKVWPCKTGQSFTVDWRGNVTQN